MNSNNNDNNGNSTSTVTRDQQVLEENGEFLEENVSSGSMPSPSVDPDKWAKAEKAVWDRFHTKKTFKELRLKYDLSHREVESIMHRRGPWANLVPEVPPVKARRRGVRIRKSALDGEAPLGPELTTQGTLPLQAPSLPAPNGRVPYEVLEGWLLTYAGKMHELKEFWDRPPDPHELVAGGLSLERARLEAEEAFEPIVEYWLQHQEEAELAGVSKNEWSNT